MSNVRDAVGGPAEDGPWGRASAPARAERPSAADGHTDASACLNCGTELIGAHCHTCGQPAHVHRTTGAFLHDLLHGALHWEGKTWHTLPLLAVRPGELTRRYVAGERARFVSPMALFLFSVFLMFAVFQIIGLSAPAGIGPVLDPSAGMAEAREDIVTRRAAVEARIAALSPDHPQLPALQAERTQLEEAAVGIGSLEEMVVREPVAQGSTDLRTGSALIDQGIAKFRENPSLMLYKLQANSYKFSWLLIPLSIPFMALLFAWRRRYGAYDHAVFVTYSLSFMTLLFVVLSVAGRLGVAVGWLVAAGTSIPLWHIYRQLKGAYSLSTFSALWRTVALAAAIGLIGLLFLNVLLLLGSLG